MIAVDLAPYRDERETAAMTALVRELKRRSAFESDSRVRQEGGIGSIDFRCHPRCYHC